MTVTCKHTLLALPYKMILHSKYHSTAIHSSIQLCIASDTAYNTPDMKCVQAWYSHFFPAQLKHALHTRCVRAWRFSMHCDVLTRLCRTCTVPPDKKCVQAWRSKFLTQHVPAHLDARRDAAIQYTDYTIHRLYTWHKRRSSATLLYMPYNI